MTGNKELAEVQEVVQIEEANLLTPMSSKMSMSFFLQSKRN